MARTVCEYLLYLVLAPSSRTHPQGVSRTEVVPELSEVSGSPGWARTSDFLINSQALYQLSYRGTIKSYRSFAGTYDSARPARRKPGRARYQPKARLFGAAHLTL